MYDRDFVKLLSFSDRNFVFYVEMLLHIVSLYLTLLRIESPFHFLTCGTKWSIYNQVECISYKNTSILFFS